MKPSLTGSCSCKKKAAGKAKKNADYAQKKWQTMNKSLIVHSNKLAPVTKSKLTFNK